MFSTSLLWGRFWCNFVHNEEKETKRHAGTWLSRLPLTKLKNGAGTSSWPSRISHFTGSFVGHSPSEMLCPPAWKRNQNIRNHYKNKSAPKYRIEVLHLYRWSTHTYTHTLDKNGSIYDPSGTESWNMQIRYETMKLTMHPTNNAGTFARVPGGCLRWPPTPPGPRWPPALNLI